MSGTRRPSHKYVEYGRAWSIHSIGDPRDRLLHRIDGPALERTDGFKEWWVRGRYVAYEHDGPRFRFFEGTLP